jgi:hypothetical protein
VFCAASAALVFTASTRFLAIVDSNNIYPKRARGTAVVAVSAA